MKMLYKPGSTINFEGVMLDAKVFSDDDIKSAESNGWGCAWSFVGIEINSTKGLPDGGEYEVNLREDIKALGGKAAGRSSISTLESQLEKLKADKDGDESSTG